MEKHPETFTSDLERSRETIDILRGEIKALKAGEKLSEARVPQ